ncbi:MAG: TonB-dependent receptor [Saprospiraceae bacterium]|nr:TonB-dependent receptor [Saprospiraceae bacterium]
MEENKRYQLPAKLHNRKLFFCCALVVLLLFSQNGYGQDCTDLLKKARKSFDLGQFQKMNATIQAMSTCENTVLIQAKRLEALYLIATDDLPNAGEKIKAIFQLRSIYQTSPLDPPLYVELVNQIRYSLKADLISSVSKSAQDIKEVPATISIVTAQEILERGYTNIEDIFHDLPGFSISNTKGITYSNIYQRGYRSGTSTDRTLILVDGIEDNSLFVGTAQISRQYALSNIERVEVIYGPASTMYGSNAYAGVINIVTKDELDYFTETTEKGNNYYLNANAAIGSYNSRLVDVTAGMRSKKVWFSLTARVFKSDEMDLSSYSNWDYTWDPDYFNDALYRENLSYAIDSEIAGNIILNDPTNLYHTIQGDSIFPTQNAIQQARNKDQDIYESDVNGSPLGFSNPTDDYSISGKVGFDNFKIGFQHWKRTEGSAPIFTDKEFAGSLNGNIWSVRQSFLYMRYDKTINNSLTISNFSRYKTHSNPPNSRQTSFDAFADGGLDLFDLIKGDKSPDWRTTYFYQEGNQFRNEFVVNYHGLDGLNLVSGLEFRNSTVQGDYIKSNVPDPHLVGQSFSIPGGNKFSVLDIAAYVQGTFEYKDFNFTTGLRMDYNKVRDAGYGTTFNPRLAAGYHKGDFVFKAIYAEAFKDATFFQKYSLADRRTLNNPDLEPEKLRNFELSSNWDANSKLSLGASYYHSQYKNIPELQEVLDSTTMMNTDQYNNVASFVIDGVQITARYKFNKYTVFGNYSYTRPYRTEASGDIRIGDIPTHQFNLGANAGFFQKRLNLNVRMNYVGNKPTGSKTTVSANPLNNIDDYLIMHTAITMRPLKRYNGFMIQFVVNNILDAEYFHPGVRTANDRVFSAITPQENRNFFARIIYEM